MENLAKFEKENPECTTCEYCGVNGWYQSFNIKKLKDENKKLREALDEIRGGGLYYGQWQDIANEALKEN